MTLHPALRLLLWPVSLAYSAAARLRAHFYRVGVLQQKRLDGMVISVGNLTVGGTGKTPLVLWLAQALEGRAKPAAILMRGYRGTGDASDEVVLLRRHLGEAYPIGVGADRHAHGQALAARGFEWFLLDDGFQHLRLARDVDIVLVDATDPFGGGFVLPAGRLREPPSALRRADIVVITRAERAPALEMLIRRHTGAPIFYAMTELEEIRPGTHSRVACGPIVSPASSRPCSADWLGKRAFAFCAVGNSRAFFDDLRTWGIELAGCRAYPDHHRYSARDAMMIEREALAAGAEILIATEKDAYNLGELMFQHLPLYHCHVTMRVREPENFWREIEDILARKRSGAALSPVPLEKGAVR